LFLNRKKTVHTHNEPERLSFYYKKPVHMSESAIRNTLINKRLCNLLIILQNKCIRESIWSQTRNVYLQNTHFLVLHVNEGNRSVTSVIFFKSSLHVKLKGKQLISVSLTLEQGSKQTPKYHFKTLTYN